MADLAADTRSWLIETLGQLTDEDVAALDPSTDLKDYGLDSIRVFQLVQKLREIRPDVQFADIAEDLTVNGIAEVIGAGAQT